jgi:hypothetical protein
MPANSCVSTAIFPLSPPSRAQAGLASQRCDCGKTHLRSLALRSSPERQGPDQFILMMSCIGRERSVPQFSMGLGHLHRNPLRDNRYCDVRVASVHPSISDMMLRRRKRPFPDSCTATKSGDRTRKIRRASQALRNDLIGAAAAGLSPDDRISVGRDPLKILFFQIGVRHGSLLRQGSQPLVK